MKKEIILDTDEDIIEYRTNIEGWVGKDGNFYGKDKERAVYANSTHKKCEKGHVYEKFWTNCRTCQEQELPSKYMQREFKEWDGKTPLCLFGEDKYFFSEDDVADYLEEEEPENIMLMICEPNYLWEIDMEAQWEDILPEDWSFEDVASKELLEKLKEVNTLIAGHSPVSWNEGKYRTFYSLTPGIGGTKFNITLTEKF